MTKIKKARIRNPGIILYAYHIREDLANQVAQDAHLFWETLSSLSSDFSIPELQKLTEKLLCYKKSLYDPSGEDGKRTDHLDLMQPEKYLIFQAVPQKNNLILSGFLYPARLHDVYAADLMFVFKDQETEASDFHLLNPNGCLLSSRIQASLGQTLFLYAEPTEIEAANQELADECVRAFFSDSEQPPPLLTNSGKLFGSPIFEYEIESEEPSEQVHLLVCLNTHPQTLELAQKAHSSIIRLLCCRSKILFAYNESRRCYRKARDVYIRLETQADEELNQLSSRDKPSQQRHRDMERFLTRMTSDALEYARYLRDMEDFPTMIKTNIHNYALRLQHIRSLPQPELEDDLKFLDEFQQRAENHFQQQIQTDLSYLLPGQNLFSQMTDTIRGLVEIDTLKQSERSEEKRSKQQNRLEILVTFIVTVLAGATISATIRPEIIANKSLPDLICLHLIVGLIFGGIAIAILVFFQNRWHK